MSEFRYEEARRLRDAGFSYTEIGERMGIARNTVSKMLKITRDEQGEIERLRAEIFELRLEIRRLEKELGA